jgi:hypothetical protein
MNRAALPTGKGQPREGSGELRRSGIHNRALEAALEMTT